MSTNKPRIALRIASILMLLHAIGHSFGMAGWQKATDPVQKNIILEMTGHQFPFMGAMHSFGDSFQGFGYGCTIAMLLISILLWLASNATQTGGSFVKSVVLVIGAALVIWAVDELLYFFPAAVTMSLLAGLLATYSGINLAKATK